MLSEDSLFLFLIEADHTDIFIVIFFNLKSPYMVEVSQKKFITKIKHEGMNQKEKEKRYKE